MGIGHQKQLSLAKTNWQHHLNHGGILRNKRRGRKARPLSTKDSIHVVFKADKTRIRTNFKSYLGFRSPIGHRICIKTIKYYAKKFHVKVSEQAICYDHIHLIIRLPKRSLGQHFLRVVAGQIAQQFKNYELLKEEELKVTDTPKSLWKHRPYTRIIKGWKAYIIAKAYVVLNEKEALGVIPYQVKRLKGLSSREWGILWL